MKKLHFPYLISRKKLDDSLSTKVVNIGRPIGRPKLPMGEAKTIQIGLRFTKSEWRKIQKEVKKSGYPTTSYLRQKINFAVMRELGMIGWGTTRTINKKSCQSRTKGRSLTNNAGF